MRRAFDIVFVQPLQRFLHDSRAIGVTLLTCTVLSLVLANISSIGEAYRNTWLLSVDGTAAHHFQAGFFHFPNSVQQWINDGLMAVFFFLVGMEIKREMLTGELSSLKKSGLPIAAAIGGMVVPALLYSLLNKGTEGIQGWAVPTATDIAFTLGIASLLGSRVPAGLKIFLTALAIIDDLGAIIVIAVFYGAHLQLLYIAGCMAIVFVLWILNRAKVKPGVLHFLLGILLWYCMFNSGIHATVSGVLFAFMIPVSSLVKLESLLHKPVHFLIMPLFALANTAILIPSDNLQVLNTPVSWGILAGLCIGKPLGIFIACFLYTRGNPASLPTDTGWYKLIGAGLLAGIGFTMSIFISTLAFTDPSQQDTAKIAVLIASFVSMIGGVLWIRFEKRSG